MSRIRERLRGWLLQGEQPAAGAEAKPQRDVSAEIAELRKAVKGIWGRLGDLSARQKPDEPAMVERLRAVEDRVGLALRIHDSAVREMLDATGRVNSIADALGIAVDIRDGGASIVAIQDENFLANAKDFMAAVRDMDLVLEAQARALRGQKAMLLRILKRETKP